MVSDEENRSNNGKVADNVASTPSTSCVEVVDSSDNLLDAVTIE